MIEPAVTGTVAWRRRLSTVAGLADLSASWRSLAATLRAYAPAAAFKYEQAADELDAAVDAQQGAPLTLRQAAHESGYSADHLGRLQCTWSPTRSRESRARWR